MFWTQSLLAGNAAGVTCLRESRETITTLNVAIYVTLLMVRNFWHYFSDFFFTFLGTMDNGQVLYLIFETNFVMFRQHVGYIFESKLKFQENRATIPSLAQKVCVSYK